MDECGGERVACADGVDDGHRHAGRLDEVIAGEQGAAARAECHAGRLPAVPGGTRAAECLRVRGKLEPAMHVRQLAFIQFHDMRDAQEVADEVGRLETRPEVDVVEPARLRQRVQQPLQ